MNKKTIRIKLSEMMEIIGGGTPKTSNGEYWDGDIPWLSVKDFNNDYRYVYETEKRITTKGLQNSSAKLLDKDDIVISARGTVGELAMIPFPMTFNQSCYGLRARDEIVDKHFLYYLLKDTVVNLKNASHGSVFDTITKNTFENIEVVLPDLGSQRAIARTLKSLDDKIENSKKINDNLDELANQIIINYSSKAKKFVPLSEVASLNRSSYTLKTLPQEILYLDTGNITNNKIEKLSFLGCEDKKPSRARRKVMENDIIYSTVRPNLRHFGLIIDPPENLVVSTGFVTITPDVQKINPMFLMNCLTTTSMTEHLHGVASTSTTAYPSIKPSDLGKIELPIFDVEDFKLINTTLNPISKKVNLNNLQNKKLTMLRDAILPKLLNSEIKL